MSPRTIIFGGLLVFCGLVATALAWAVPMIEMSLATEATDALRQRNLTFAHVRAEGRDLIITGEAPDERRRQEARRIVVSTPGQRVVFDRMTVASAALVPPPPMDVVPTATRADGLTVEQGACQDAINRLMTGTKIAFDFGSTVLTVDNEPLLDDLATAMDECPKARVEVGGHTDSQGSDVLNRRLSQKRAQSVVEALISRGVDARRLEAVGYGSSRPIASNVTLKGKQQNRRIELRVRKD